MTIYIHGFGGSGQGIKASAFREYFKSINKPFIAPSLPYVPELAIKTLEELIESYNEDVTLIGSSLGGYFSIYLADKYNLKAVLLNPSVNPKITLKRAIGYAPSFYDESCYKWCESHLDSLDNYEIKDINKELYLLMVQKGDELIDYKEAVEKLDGCEQIVEDGGNHSYENIENHFKNIENFLKV